MKLAIRYQPIAALVPYARNARSHSDAQIAQIAGSIREFGFVNPVIVDADGSIVAGHGRVLAAQRLDMTEVPTLSVDHLTPQQVKAFRLADNRIAMNSDWDTDLLGLELSELQLDGVDIESLGFDLDELPDVDAPADDGDPDETPDTPDAPWVKRGDIFQLGGHRIMCGDSTDPADVTLLMAGAKADMVFTDPPYGIDENTDRVDHYAGFKKGAKAANAVYAPIAGDKTTEVAHASIAIAMDLAPIAIFWGGNYYKLPPSACWLVWDKRVEDEHRNVNSDCELAWIKHPHKKSVRIFRHLWKGMIKASEQGERRCHPTQKPVALANWCFNEYDPKGKTVLDLFLGSGSTLIAAEKAGRACYGMEIEPAYIQVILERWAAYTGQEWVKLPLDQAR